MFPTLTAAQVARVAAHGRARQAQKGEVLVEAGERSVRFFVVNSGQIEIVSFSGKTEELVAVCQPGMFTGEIAILSGRRGLVQIRASEAAAHWPLARSPHLLETSLPGVFAVGDVRGGSLKRVASAVGEGSIAVAFVHQVLHE